MTPSPARRPFPWSTLIAFSLGPLSMGVISLLAWFIVGGGAPRGPQRIEYVIPAGTAALVAAGGDLQTIPNRAVFVVGDQLVFHNQDAVNHEIGPFWLPAQSTVSVVLQRASYTNYICSVHPSGEIGMEVRSANSFWWTLLPTLALGLPIGLGLSLIVRVMSRL